jgi:predicted MFS family arabinose efflux permease
MMEPMSKQQKTILFTMFISTFAAFSPGILTGTLLIDIADTFSAHIGTVSTIRTYSSGIGVLAAVLMGAFSVRYKHKTLLLSGLSLLSISAIGCFIAPTARDGFLRL